MTVRAVVLVEGVSDRAAVETLARRRGRDLTGEGVAVVALGGATNLGHALARYGPGGEDLLVTGLCDAAEEPVFRRMCARAGLGEAQDRTGLEALGFSVCVEDLEDELIRALGVDGVERVLAAEGDLDRFRLFQRQPAQSGRPVERLLRRFLGTTSGRKEQYAQRLVEALDLDRVPAPLDAVLARTAR